MQGRTRTLSPVKYKGGHKSRIESKRGCIASTRYIYTLLQLQQAYIGVRVLS